MQNGSSDCGLFALASVTALAIGEEPGSHVFDQKQMRPHMIKCLEAGIAEGFPVRKSRRMLKKIKLTFTVPVFCTCRLPKKSDCTMIKCSDCTEWFHVGICVDVESSALDRGTKLLCTSCQSKRVQ